MILQQKTTVIDLNWLLSYSDILQSLLRSTIANEQQKNSVFTNPRFHSKAPIQNLRRPLQRKLSSQIFLMLRPISNDGLCPTNVLRKPKRYRNLLKGFASKTLSLRISWQSLTKQFSKCKREKKLPNISRLCTGTDQKGKSALRKRRLWYHFEKYCLRFGRNRHRSMPVTVSMGSASKVQKCCKTPYADGPKRLNTDIYMHYKRCSTRNNSFSNFASGTLGHICHGQRIYRFCNII